MQYNDRNENMILLKEIDERQKYLLKVKEWNTFLHHSSLSEQDHVPYEESCGI